jgi:hypothetical protein
MIAQFTYPACSPYLGETPIEDTLPSAAAATAASSSSLPQLLQLPTNQIDDYDLTDDEYDEDLFLALSHEEALFLQATMMTAPVFRKNSSIADEVNMLVVPE